MTAFRHAWQTGTRWIETDTQPSADGTPTLIHDDEVDRTTDGTGPVRSLTDATLELLDAGSSHGPEFAAARIPLLAELLDNLTNDRRLLLEIKGDHSSDELRTILAAIERAQAADRVLLQSFEVPVLERLHAMLPHDPLGLLVEHLPARHHTDEIIAQCRRLGAITYNPDVDELLAQPGLIAELHGADIAVMPWTVNDPAQWDRLIELGVDGIITDRPAELVAHLARPGSG